MLLQVLFADCCVHPQFIWNTVCDKIYETNPQFDYNISILYSILYSILESIIFINIDFLIDFIPLYERQMNSIDYIL